MRPGPRGARIAASDRAARWRSSARAQMISITSKSPYAVLALAELGRSAGPDPVPIGELARRRDVPVQFLEQLFAALRRVAS